MKHEIFRIVSKWLFACAMYQVSDEYEVFEDLIGLVQLDNITADTIYSALKDSITRLGLDFANCRGQGYNGA